MREFLILWVKFLAVLAIGITGIALIVGGFCLLGKLPDPWNAVSCCIFGLILAAGIMAAIVES